jgi:hypothetical protein
MTLTAASYCQRDKRRRARDDLARPAEVRRVAIMAPHATILTIADGKT